MPTAVFTSFDEGDVVEVQFVSHDGETHSSRLFVDSGFTGETDFILSQDLARLSLGNVAAAYTSGALEGRQRRILVDCRIPTMGLQHKLVAIITDIASLSLPPGVDGMVGLLFLRRFQCWGGERTDSGVWEFFLSDGNE